VYKLDYFVGFIGDEQVHAQECYARVIFHKSRVVVALLHSSDLTMMK
jgi:hypothetical protein